AEHGVIESATMNSSAHVARPDQMLEALQKERILQLAIAALEEDHRELIVLRDIEHMSYEQIPAITGLPQGTVKSRLHRARHALRAKVKSLSEGPRRSPSPSPSAHDEDALA